MAAGRKFKNRLKQSTAQRVFFAVYCKIKRQLDDETLLEVTSQRLLAMRPIHYSLTYLLTIMLSP